MFHWRKNETLALLVLIGQEYGGLFDNDESESAEVIPLTSTADDPDPLSLECVTHEMQLGRHDHSNVVNLHQWRRKRNS